ncbi:MAG: hypothetical protein RR605_00750 [Acinetobacter sp.]
MELTLEKLDQLDQEFEKFKANLVNTENKSLKDMVAFLDKHRPNQAFQLWALMMLDREQKREHTEFLSSQLWAAEDQINELLGRGAEVIKERDELLEVIKIHAPDWESKLLWCVEIAEEPDSPFEQTPASNKSIAQRVVNRYHSINNNSYCPEIAKSANSCIRVSMWHGLAEEHIVDLLNEAWFDLSLFKCDSPDHIEMAFKAKDLVKCTNQGKVLVTKDIDEAKRFFGVA